MMIERRKRTPRDRRQQPRADRLPVRWALALLVTLTALVWSSVYGLAHFLRHHLVLVAVVVLAGCSAVPTDPTFRGESSGACHRLDAEAGPVGTDPRIIVLTRGPCELVVLPPKGGPK